MKLAIASDIHLEFGDILLKNEENADVLILAGDVFVAKTLTNKESKLDIKIINKFFKYCSKHFKDVIYIAGNHEHYRGDFTKTNDIIRKFIKKYSNIHFLDKEIKTIDDVTFIGGTLWTDMNNEDIMTMSQIRNSINDFRLIGNCSKTVTRKVPSLENDVGYKYKEYPAKFSPEDSVEEHKKMLKVIEENISLLNQKCVIIGHHAPSKQSIFWKYQDEHLMNGGFVSDLSNFILKYPQIKLWIHGHTHNEFDYMIGQTRVICNPRGYKGYELRADEFQLKYIEI